MVSFWEILSLKKYLVKILLPLFNLLWTSCGLFVML